LELKDDGTRCSVRRKKYQDTTGGGKRKRSAIQVHFAAATPAGHKEDFTPAKVRRTTTSNDKDEEHAGEDEGNEDMEEELMPELVVLVLSYINCLGLVACQFVCTAWMVMMCAMSL
jgi:hypothetical protein